MEGAYVDTKIVLSGTYEYTEKTSCRFSFLYLTKQRFCTTIKAIEEIISRTIVSTTEKIVRFVINISLFVTSIPFGAFESEGMLFHLSCYTVHNLFV